MNTEVCRKINVAFAAAATGFAALAAAPDLTASMHALGNPNKARWSSLMPRHVASIGVHDGRLYVSGGNWDGNAGPCPLFAVDPYSGASNIVFTMGTESVDYFREGTGGRFYVPSIDPKDGHVNSCDVACRNPDGTWTKMYACARNLGDALYDTHTWDFAVWHGWMFAGGYGLSVEKEGASGRMRDASPYLTSAHMTFSYKMDTGATGSFQRWRRFTAFLPFDDELFALPLNVCYFDDTSVTTYDIEEYRFDEATALFVCQTNTPARLYPGLCPADFGLFKNTSSAIDLKMWHPTPFRGRVLYIPGSEASPFIPVGALYSATNENHHVVATRIVLGSGVYPLCIFSRGDAVCVLAAQYDDASRTVVNSVWESTDALHFEKKFTFSAPQQASAVAYFDGAYYFALGSRTQVSQAWSLSGSDGVGELYRVRDPSVTTTLEVVAESATLALPEGGVGVARFKLNAPPARTLALAVTVNAGSPSVATEVSSVTFTPDDWSDWHEVPFAVSDDGLDGESVSTITLGKDASASVWAASVVVAAANNDVRVVEAPPAGIEDLTSPEGTFTAPSSQWAMKPFNDDATCSDAKQRVLLRTSQFAIAYTFAEKTVVNAYGLYNYANTYPEERAPHAWTFEGSDDGETWTKLDERLYERDWSAGEYRYYSFANTTPFRMYRIAIFENNGADFTQFSHLEFYDTRTALDAVETLSAGSVAAASTSHKDYGPAGAFDGNRENAAGRWLAVRAAEMFVVYRFDTATVVDAIRLWNGSDSKGKGGYDSAGRAPKDWTFAGSHDGENWTVLDARADETGWASTGEARLYAFANDTAYAYYRFCCTALNDAASSRTGGAEYLQLWEIEFLRSRASADRVPDPVFGGAGVGAPSFGVDASGERVFSFAICNAVKGARYQVYRAARLTEKFEPWGEAVTAEADGVLAFAVATEGAASGFFTVEVVK